MIEKLKKLKIKIILLKKNILFITYFIKINFF